MRATRRVECCIAREVPHPERVGAASKLTAQAMDRLRAECIPGPGDGPVLAPGRGPVLLETTEPQVHASGARVESVALVYDVTGGRVPADRGCGHRVTNA